MSIKENIKKIREMYDLTQQDLADIAGVTNKAVSAWEKGLSEPRMGAIERIAQRFGFMKSNIIEDNGMNNLFPGTQLETKTVNQNHEVPLYGAISAGMPLEMIKVEEHLGIPASLLDRYPRAFLLRVSGDSMNKVVNDGSLALIDPCEEVNNGDIAAVAVNGYDATLKRFYKLQNTVALEPDSHNPEHIAKLYGQEEEPILKIIGRMVWFMAPFDAKF